MSSLETIQQKLSIQIPEKILLKILFEMNKFFEKELTEEIQNSQKKNKIVFNSIQRRILRKHFYYSDKLQNDELDIQFPHIKPTIEDKETISNESLARIEKYDSEKILNSIITRYNNLLSGAEIMDNQEQWLNYYNNKREHNSDYSLFVLKIDQAQFVNCKYNINGIFQIIANAYAKLENYRHIAIIFDGDIKNQNNEIVTWQLMYKIGIYCENFKQFTDKFFPFHKEDQIDELSNFIKERFNTQKSRNIAETFYSSISYGFKFEDCYIREDANQRFLVFKKIELDNNNVPCP